MTEWRAVMCMYITAFATENAIQFLQILSAVFSIEL